MSRVFAPKLLVLHKPRPNIITARNQRKWEHNENESI
jgi:hypothetical protein